MTKLKLSERFLPDLIHQKLKFSANKFIQYDFDIPNNADSSANM